LTRARTLILALALLAGCTCEPIEGHSPLNEICERIKLPWKHSDSVYTTVGTNIYTTSLERFNARHPHGSTQREALLRHEAVHARRQFDYQDLPGEMALWTWIARYTTDAGFMWREEQHALYAEITYLREQGQWSQFDTLEQAEALERVYRTVTGKKMVTSAEAVEWINKVLGGQWKP
jgi:hypothetical protein